MNLKDLLLMEVPLGALKQVYKDEGFKGKTGSEDIADAIASGKPDRAIELAKEFQFAGATAVNIHVLMSPISADWHNKVFFKTHLINKYGDGIFITGIRPNLSDVPQLVRTYDLGEKIVLAFSFLGSPRRYLDNYQIVTRRPQILEYVIIHFSPFAVEIRSSLALNELFKQAVLDIMGIEDDVAWDKLTKLNDEQAKDLARRTDARLRSAKHKMTNGVYATKEVTAHTQVPDLAATKEYQAEFNNMPMKKKTLILSYRYSFGYIEDVSFSITEEGLWFRTHVGEEVISYMLDHILKIKYPIEEIGEEIHEGLENVAVGME